MQTRYSALERFLRYVKFGTQSVDGADKVPSSDGQHELARALADELAQIDGVRDIVCDEHAYVTATLPGNTKKSGVPTVGFIAHIDTATEVSGEGVKPRVVEAYSGGDIKLDADGKYILAPTDFPMLKDVIGMDLVVTDGTTLLGADDKAGVAEIMAAVEWLSKHPEVERGDVKIAFTPDEEIGHAASLLDIEKFGADFAYTLDGGPIGEYGYENFNAARAQIKIIGRSVHPGAAKNKMLNAVMLAVELIDMFPKHETPETTEGYEGYYYCNEIEGSVEAATLNINIREHDGEKFAARKAYVEKCVDWMRDKYGAERFELSIKEQYRNMREKLEDKMEIVDTMVDAMRELGITPFKIACRGGTDGARLSWRGLPTPNLFTGEYNAHSRFEFVPVQGLEAATDVIIKMVELFEKRAR